MHNIVYKEEVLDITRSIDQKSKHTYIFRVLRDNIELLFSCHVSVNGSSAFVEIAHSTTNIAANLFRLRPLFKHLKVSSISWEREFDGELQVFYIKD